MFLRVVLLFLASFFLFGCQSIPEPTDKIVIHYPPELEEAHDLALKKKTDDARIKVEDYLNKAENIHWFGHAYFLKGFLFEMDDKYPEAIQFYRKTIEHSVNFESKVQAKALYNLSFVYEKTGQMDHLLTSLVDLMKRRQFFDTLTRQVELPARLASAYAAQGNLVQAQHFHNEAKENYKTLIKKAGFRAKHMELSKALYYLGVVVYDPQKEDFKKLIKKLELGQKYLLASAESSNSIWSQKAADQLETHYDKAWGVVLSYAPKEDLDPQAFKKRKHMKQLEMSSQLYDLAHQLKAEEFPLTNVNRVSQIIMENNNKWLETIEKFALKLDLGPQMVRNKKVKNSPLIRYVEKKQEPAVLNKEVAKKEESTEHLALPPKETGETSKDKNSKDIGKDPNL